MRAQYGALRLQESVKRYAEAARRDHGVNVQIRVVRTSTTACRRCWAATRDTPSLRSLSWPARVRFSSSASALAASRYRSQRGGLAVHGIDASEAMVKKLRGTAICLREA